MHNYFRRPELKEDNLLKRQLALKRRVEINNNLTGLRGVSKFVNRECSKLAGMLTDNATPEKSKEYDRESAKRQLSKSPVVEPFVSRFRNSDLSPSQVSFQNST